MDKKSATHDLEPTNHFTVDLGAFELTDEDVGALQSEITKLAVECVRNRTSLSASQVASKPREPYVKITYVQATHVKSIRRP